jgi:ankyrin repeat protein
MNGITPLLLAASYSDKDVYDLLVEHGADEDVSDYRGNIPLSYVIYFGEEGYLDFAKYLIEKGAVSDINKLSDYGEAPLYWALSAANYEGADLLIEYGANIDLKNISGNTLLHAAVENNDLQAVKYLVEKGANLDPENEWGETPLQLSQAYEFTEISEYLKEMGAK